MSKTLLGCAWCDVETIDVRKRATGLQYCNDCWKELETKPVTIKQLADKLDELKDYASAGRKGNSAVSYDAIERLAQQAITILGDLKHKIEERGY